MREEFVAYSAMVRGRYLRKVVCIPDIIWRTISKSETKTIVKDMWKGQGTAVAWQKNLLLLVDVMCVPCRYYRSGLVLQDFTSGVG